ncbi:MAG TPA: YihY/virulence factor BrkB family protein [Gemmatimonadaceae bacterium]|nr:YihY/virulence factor BrkB family protein [Gemmatimonadaceae bacterium]
MNSGEDGVFFLAGGVAFNILLAVLPFVLLVVSGLALLLDVSTDASTIQVQWLLDRFLPPHSEAADSPVHRVIRDVVRTRGTVGLLSALTFIWASTRLFGSLRTVLAHVLDIENERGIVAGKLFDIVMTVVSMLLLVTYLAISVYGALATSRGVQVMLELGLRQDVMGRVEYWLGRLLASAAVTAMFYGLIKYLPRRRVRWRSALIGAITTTLLLEAAKSAYVLVVGTTGVGGLFTGVLATVVSVVFWVYYAALIFLIGGEVTQIHEQRRVRAERRETFG